MSPVNLTRIRNCLEDLKNVSSHFQPNITNHRIFQLRRWEKHTRKNVSQTCRSQDQLSLSRNDAGNVSGYDTEIKEKSDFLRTTTFPDPRNGNGENLKITAHKKIKFRKYNKNNFYQIKWNPPNNFLLNHYKQTICV